MEPHGVEYIGAFITTAGAVTLASLATVASIGTKMYKEYQVGKRTDELAEAKLDMVPEAISEREKIGEEKKGRAIEQKGLTDVKASQVTSQTIGQAYDKGDTLMAKTDFATSTPASKAISDSIKSITATSIADSELRTAKLDTILAGVEEKTLMDVAELQARRNELEAELGRDLTEYT